jgi:cobalt-zinc-cadmium efflux system membrane fusion protein
MKKKISFVLLLVSLAVCGLALSSCDKPAASAPSSANPAATPGVVQTAVAQLQPVADTLELAAKVQADPARMVHVFPPAGGRIVNLQVHPGDRVTRGQTLAVLQSNDIATARSDYGKALAEKERAARTFQRAQLLFDHQVMAEKDYLDAKADAATAESELRRASQLLQLWGVPLDGISDEFTVKAPRPGVVLDLGAAPGEYSKALDSQQPLCTVADLTQVWIVGEVYEKDLGSLKRGFPVEIAISAYPGRTWKGTVDNVSDQVDPVTRTLKLRVVLSNPDATLKPEMFAQIRVVRGSKSTILLPQAAVLHNGERTEVIVESSAGHYEERPVQLGATRGDQVEIASGVKPGEHVVIAGAALLRPSQDAKD